MGQEDKVWYAVMQSTDHKLFEVINILSIPTFNQSWIVGDEVQPPIDSVMYRDLKYKDKSGFVAFVGTKEEADNKCSELSKLDLDNFPKTSSEEAIAFNAKLSEFYQVIEGQAKKISKLEDFQRENQYLIRKAQSIDSNCYNIIGIGDLKVINDDLAMAIAKDDLSGFSELAEQICHVKASKTSGNKWSAFSDDKRRDLDSLLSYYVVMKDKYEEKKKQSVLNEPLSKQESKLILRNETLETRFKRVKLSFQRKMQGGPDNPLKRTSTEGSSSSSKKKKKATPVFVDSENVGFESIEENQVDHVDKISTEDS